MQYFDVAHETPQSAPAKVEAGAGLGTSDHAVPFHRMIIRCAVTQRHVGVADSHAIALARTRH